MKKEQIVLLFVELQQWTIQNVKQISNVMVIMLVKLVLQLLQQHIDYKQQTLPVQLPPTLQLLDNHVQMQQDTHTVQPIIIVQIILLVLLVHQEHQEIQLKVVLESKLLLNVAMLVQQTITMLQEQLVHLHVEPQLWTIQNVKQIFNVQLMLVKPVLQLLQQHTDYRQQIPLVLLQQTQQLLIKLVHPHLDTLSVQLIFIVIQMSVLLVQLEKLEPHFNHLLQTKLMLYVLLIAQQVFTMLQELPVFLLVVLLEVKIIQNALQIMNVSMTSVQSVLEMKLEHKIQQLDVQLPPHLSSKFHSSSYLSFLLW